MLFVSLSSSEFFANSGAMKSGLPTIIVILTAVVTIRARTKSAARVRESSDENNAFLLLRKRSIQYAEAGISVKNKSNSTENAKGLWISLLIL
jgi:hypothetical protein